VGDPSNRRYAIGCLLRRQCRRPCHGRNLALELAPYRIRVNAVAPAVVETPVYNTFMSDEQVKQVLPTFDTLHPLGRNGQPKDVAEAILFLASDQASWITGTVLPVDGGVTAGRQ